MSTCISRHGEYSDHTPNGEYTCTRCGVLDEDGLTAELLQLRAALEHGVGVKPAWLVLDEIADERVRQDETWGEQNHPNGTGPDWPVMGAGALFSGHAAKIVRLKVQSAARHGTTTWHGVLAEEFHEAMAENDPAALRAELVQIAAVAVAWIEAIDRGSTT